MNAMTWWDHQTQSVWSQVWGQSIAGQLKGTTLELIPASIVPWVYLESRTSRHPGDDQRQDWPVQPGGTTA